MSESDKSNLISLVEKSFSGTIRPDDDHIISGYKPAMGSSPDVVPDFPIFMDMIKGKDWKDFLHVLETEEFSTVQSYGSTFYHLTPEALHYFAPALIIYSINKDSDIAGSIIYNILSPHPPPQNNQFITYTRDRLKLFTDREKHAIAKVIYYFDEYDIDDYLRKVWAPWLAPSH